MQISTGTFRLRLAFFSCFMVIGLSILPFFLESATFVHPEKRYTITFPTDWVKREMATSGLDVNYSSPQDPADESSDAAANVKTALLPPEVTLDQFYTVNIENLKKDFKDFKIIQEGQDKISGKDTRFIVYSYDNEGVSITIRQYFLLIDNMGYLFTFGARSDIYKDYEAKFDEMVKSIII